MVRPCFKKKSIKQNHSKCLACESQVMLSYGESDLHSNDLEKPRPHVPTCHLEGRPWHATPLWFLAIPTPQGHSGGSCQGQADRSWLTPLCIRVIYATCPLVTRFWCTAVCTAGPNSILIQPSRDLRNKAVSRNRQTDID